MCVGPNRVMTGVSNAAAKWRGPESVVIKSAARRTQAFESPRLSGCSARLTTRGMVGQPRRSPGPVPLGGTAEHEHRGRRLLDQPARQPRQMMRWASSSPARTLLPYSDKPTGCSARKPRSAQARSAADSSSRGGLRARAESSRPGSPASSPGPGNTPRSASGESLPSASRGGWRLSVRSSPRPYRT